MGEIRQIESVAKFSDFSVINSDFTRARCRVMYTGRNRNHSDITEDALNKLITRKGYANVPVVAHLYKGDDGKWRVGGHDSKIVISAEGGFEIVDETIPFGVVPENCNPSFEDVTEDSGEVKRYFCVDVILWTHRYNIMDAVKSDELWFNQSMEISINHCDYDRDDYCVIDDFSWSAYCLLNHDPYNRENEVEPCFPSAGVKKFDLDNEKIKSEFDVLYSKLKEFEISIGKGEVKMELDAIKSKLDTKYSALSATPDFVCAMNKENFEVYEIPYTIDAEKSEVAFTYDKAVKKYLAVADTDSGVELVVKDCAAEFGKVLVAKTEAEFAKKAEAVKAEITKGFIEKLDEKNAEYAALQSRYDVDKQKLDAYEAAEVKAREDAHKAEIDGVISSYEKRLSKNTDFFLYKSQIDYSKTAKEVEQDMLIILGKSVKDDPAKFSYAAWGAQTTVPKRGNSDKYSDKYGDLLDGIDDD